MQGTANLHSLNFPTVGLSIAAGVLVAVCSVLVLSISFVWAGAVTVGLCVAVLSLTARSFKHYWLAIFILVLPLEVKKMLVDSSHVIEHVETYGFPVGELPGPVLYLSDLPFLVLMLQWILEISLKHRKVILPRYHWLALGFIVWAGLSLGQAQDLTSGIFDLLRWMKLYLLYLYVANNITSVRTIRVAVICLLATCILQGLLCVQQYVMQDVGYILARVLGQQALYSERAVATVDPLFNVSGAGGIRRASGTVGPINAQAEFFELLLPLAFLLSQGGTQNRRRLFYLAAFVVGMMGLIVTFSRGGLVGLMAAIAAVVWLAGRYGQFSPKRCLAFAAIAAILGIGLSPLAYRYMMTRPEAATARLHLARVGLAMVADHPVLGVGLNNHVVRRPEYDPHKYVFQMPTHNHYIVLASEVGLPGFLLLLGFLMVSGRHILRVARGPDAYRAVVALGLFGGLAGVAVHCLCDVIGTHTILTLLWLYAGLGAALYESQLRRVEGTS